MESSTVDETTCSGSKDDRNRSRSREWVPLPGRHNMANAMAAACAAVVAGADLDAVRRGLQGYCPLPHRLECVGVVAGRRFYNDSLATTPESAIVALEAFSQPVVVLAGGYDKQIDLSRMAETIARKAKAAALIGQTAEQLACLLETQRPSDDLPIKECRSFDEAFRWAVDQSQPGDVVLLSPGWASFGWFRNYADRGRQFARLVEAWRNEVEVASR